MFSMSVCLTIFNNKHSVGLVERLPSVHEVLGSVPSTAKANRTNYIKFRAQWSALYFTHPPVTASLLKKQLSSLVRP